MESTGLYDIIHNGLINLATNRNALNLTICAVGVALIANGLYHLHKGKKMYVIEPVGSTFIARELNPHGKGRSHE